MALGVVALVAVLAVLGLANAGGDEARQATSSDASSTTADPADGDERPAPTTAPTTAERTAPARTATTVAARPRPDGVPADWVLYRDPDVGYSIWHPPSWRPTPLGDSRTDLVDAATGDYLRVDYVENPGDDPEKAWKDSSKSFAKRYDDYEELRIEELEYQGYPAAIWEYTYLGNHATNLGFVTDDYGFALNFQTAEERWEDRQGVRRAFEASFAAP